MKIKPAPTRPPARVAHSDAYLAYLSSDGWRRVREAALDHAYHRCTVCGATGGLEVHHRHYRTLGAEAPADLVVLCRACHRDADRRRAHSRRTR